MKIIKYFDFIKEDAFQDPPEEFINIVLMKLKKKIESIFDFKNEDDEKTTNLNKALEKGKKKKGSDMTFKDLGVSLESSELSKYSAQYDSIKIIFADPDFRYDLFITIPLEEALNKDKSKDFSDKEIKKCTYKFKKYDLDQYDLVGQIGPKTVNIEDIDEDFLVNLKVELDSEFGDDEELEFET